MTTNNGELGTSRIRCGLGNTLLGFWKRVKFSVGPICSCSIAAIRLAVASLSGTEGPLKKNTVEKWNWISIPPLYSLLSRAAFLRRQAPVSQELKSILSIEVSRNNAKLYSHKQNKQIRSPCCAGTCTAVLSRRETIAHDLPAQNEFQTATWERSPRAAPAPG